MLARFSWLLPVAVLSLAACGSSTPGGSTSTSGSGSSTGTSAGGCGPSSCAGCCDAQGFCQLPTTDHCGLGGVACTPCGSGLFCSGAGVCEIPGSSSGSGSGSTSSTSSTGSSTGSTTGSSGSSGSTGGSGSSGSTGGANCCLSMSCSAGCDPVACQCLQTTTGTTTTGGGLDAGALCNTQSCVVYAEAARTLYRVDPSPPNAITQVCNFNGAIHPDAGVNDIAVTRNGNLYGITKNDLYTIDPQSCTGTFVATLAANHGDYNCLTFTDSDTLVAADGSGQVVTIDVGTGNVSDAGHFGGNYGCSGDIVALSNGTIYATAKLLNSTTSNDVLVTLDPASGYQATPVSANNLGYKGIFGLGYWGGTLYGFDKNGHELAIDPVQGTSSLLHTVTNVTFYGAGTTPLAPVVTH